MIVVQVSFCFRVASTTPWQIFCWIDTLALSTSVVMVLLVNLSMMLSDTVYLAVRHVNRLADGLAWRFYCHQGGVAFVTLHLQQLTFPQGLDDGLFEQQHSRATMRYTNELTSYISIMAPIACSIKALEG